MVVAVAAIATAVAFPMSSSAATLFLIQGGGWGHGVGMGQWGAEGYAQHGWTARAILAHYYPHTTLERVPSQTLRVLLAQQPRVAIRSRKPFLLVDARGTKVHVPARTLRFGAALRIGKQKLVSPVQVEPGAAVLSFDGKAYYGSFTLVRSNGKLSVVDDVPLELYLRGVVPAEMPTRWLPAAYEAQAVASRSYALAAMRGTGIFDLYADTRDQMYGGIAAERPQTTTAVGQTAGEVLTYDGKTILAFYSASTGGRTESVQDAFPGRAPVPYLVSVRDPYDTISPAHRWHLRLRLQALASRLGFAATDVLVQHDTAGHATQVELVGAHGNETITGDAFAQALDLRSSRFSIEALSLASPLARAAFNQPFALRGFVRDAAHVSLQELEPGGGWRLVGLVHASPDGRFAIEIHPQASTTYRLAVAHVAGPAVAVHVVPRLSIRASGNVVTGTIRPAVPLRVERNVDGAWHVVAQLPVGPSGYFRTKLHMGRYRLASSANRTLASATSESVIIVD
jgi:stage II sporulation protein D